MHIIPASSRYYALVPSDDEDYDKTPIIGFAWRGDGVPAVITPEGSPVCYAVEYPNGRVFSPASMKHFENADDFIDHEGFSEGAVAPVTITSTVMHSPRLRDLGVSGRACAPLERQGIKTLADLATQGRSVIADVKGVSRESLSEMESHLHAAGLGWAGAVKALPLAADDEDDDLSEVL